MKYPSRFTRWTPNRELFGDTGTVENVWPDDWTEGAKYWGAIQTQFSTVEDEFGQDTTKLTATIALNGNTDVESIDRLTDTDGNVWMIESIYPGKGETIHEVEAYTEIEA